MSDPTLMLAAPQASSIAASTDRLLWTLLAVTGAMGVLLAALVIGLSLRYRSGRRDVDRSHPPSRNPVLEASWVAFPLLLFLGMFAWGAHAWVAARRVPPDALVVHVVARQWMWRLQHAGPGGGRQEIDELHVPVGRPVVLVMSSQDVIHSFFVPAFRLKQDVVPGRYTRLSFTPTALGEFRVLCAEFCGTEHAAMLGRVVVMRPADYARWLESGPPLVAGEPSPAQRGQALYAREGCGACHDPGSSVHAPSLAGLYGREVTLQGGARVAADDDYLRRSILVPKADVVAGQSPLMPSFAQRLTEAEVQDLVAFLRAPRGEGPP